MGVALGEIIQGTEIEFEFLAGKKVAVDAYNALYQFLSVIRQRDGTPLVDAKGRITSHLSGLFYRSVRLVEAGIKPIYVFDGMPPALKKETVEKRREARESAAEKWRQALERGDLEEARVRAQASSRLSDEMVGEAKELLELMGIACIQAPCEGEAQAAYLVQKGKVYAAASQDFDSLLFGSPLLVRNLTASGKRKLPGRDIYIKVKPELIELEKSLGALGIDRKKLVWLAILIGTDYNSGVKGYGPKKALKLVKECGSLEQVVGRSGEWVDADPYEIEKIFLEPDVDESAEFGFGVPDREKLLKFLCDEHSFMQERVENSVNALVAKSSEKSQQMKLGEW